MSKEIDDGGPAFPIERHLQNGNECHYGMTLRDWFAGQALASMDGRERDGDFGTMPGIAVYCYIIADTMLEKRKILDTKEKEE